MIKIDDYGRKYIVAPEGKLLKGYRVDVWGYIEHCLVDQWGLVFTRGDDLGFGGGWSGTQHSKHHRVVVFPNPVDRGNDGWDNQCWSHEDWYERNWLCDSWAWMYMKASAWRELDELRGAA